MILGILEITVPLLGIMAVGIIAGSKDRSKWKKPLLYAGGITMGLIVVFGLLGSFMYDYRAPSDADHIRTYAELGYTYPIEAMWADRARLLRLDAIRSLIFVALGFGSLFYFLRNNKIKPLYLYLVLGVLILADLWPIANRYLNQSHFIKSQDHANLFVPSQVDLAIMNDPDLYYRVQNRSVPDMFSDGMTSYHHKSIGGYHAAKLGRYQDIIDRYILSNNQQVFNMLNTRYIIFNDQNGNLAYSLNSGALGNAWFIDNIQWVSDADEELESIYNFNPANTVLIDERYRAYMSEFQTNKDPAAVIQLVSYGPKRLDFQYSTQNGAEQFAVFSDIYYEGGNHDWKAYVDNQQVSLIRVNYLLRGMRLPAGNHLLTFEFRPRSFLLGSKISLAGSILLVLFVVGCFYFSWRRSRS